MKAIGDNMKIIKAPEPLPVQRRNGIVRGSIFLAGSIEMGKAINWQKTLTDDLADDDYIEYVFNPRRDDWDSTWTQSIMNEQFNTQVSWELTAQDIAETIFMYFSPETKSPITLLELGLYAPTGKMLVYCPEGFWRKGNVEMVCDRFNVPLYDDFDIAREVLFDRFKTLLEYS